MTPVNNGPFWAGYIEDVFVPHIRMFRTAIFDRMLPTFSDIDKEAEQYGDEVLDQIATVAHPESDFGDLAEAALDASITHSETLYGVRQTVLNMCAVALHHMMEQQQLILLRRELLPRREEHKEVKGIRAEFEDRLKDAGLDPEAYDSDGLLRDLHLAANAIKHGDGWSVEKLKERRPELFVYPGLRRDPKSHRFVDTTRVETPLSGDDLYVDDEDLNAFCQAVEDYWHTAARDFYGDL